MLTWIAYAYEAFPHMLLMAWSIGFEFSWATAMTIGMVGLAMGWLALQRIQEAIRLKQIAFDRPRTLRFRWLKGGKPHLQIQHGDATIEVVIEKKLSHTIMIARFPPLPCDSIWTITTSRSSLGLAERLELPRVGIHKLWTDSLAVVQPLVSPRAHWELAELVGSSACRSCSIESNKEAWIYKGEFEPLTEAQVELCLNRIIAFYDQLRVAAREEVSFLDSQSPTESQTICRICGHSMQEPPIRCVRCKTPFHRDCWEYNGKCGIFGCLESRWESPSTLPQGIDDLHPDGA